MATETETKAQLTDLAKDLEERGESTIKINFEMVGQLEPLYVIRLKTTKGQPKRYLRASTISTMIGVANLAMATRFDSAVWAATIAATLAGAKIRRLKTKSKEQLKTSIFKYAPVQKSEVVPEVRADADIHDHKT